ncbi:signal recognition particle-docking protein FtsY [Chlamydiota bacterium]
MLNIFKKGLVKTREKIRDRIQSIIPKKTTILSQTMLEELEECLIEADMGVNTVLKIIDDLRTVKFSHSTVLESAITEIKADISDLFTSEEALLTINKNGGPTVILFIGVNGTGKTTSIAKIAHKLIGEGRKVLLGAADTYRAAAIDQLDIWAKRLSVDIIKHSYGADSAAVAYDSIEAAIARNVDYLLIDTAGRLHTKKNLMEELKKIKRVLQKKLSSAPHEILLVLDGTTGQNALQQTKFFNDSLSITGIVITKLDGTAKGGIVASIKKEVGIPIKFVGLGEELEDLQQFNPTEFIDALFDA